MAQQPGRAAARLGRVVQHVAAVGSLTSSEPAKVAGGLVPCHVGAVADASGEGVLEGIRVVELATVVAAPMACAYLADMGADVIKIESPSTPDLTRAWGHGDDPARTASPELFRELKARRGGGGSAYVQLNRGKRSLLLDIQLPEGLAVLKRLLATADVFVTNLRVKALQKVGLDYEALHSVLPRLVYAHFTAFGREGPKVNDPGYDFGAWWAHTGIMDLLKSSEDGHMPRFPGAIGDNSTAVQLAGYIGTALFHRERTGRGQLVDASLLRSGIAAIAQPLVQYAGGNRWGNGKGDFHIRSTTKIGERKTLVTDMYFRCKCGTWVYLLGLDFKVHIGRTLTALGLSMAEVFGQEKLDSSVDYGRATRVVDQAVATKTFDEWSEIFKRHDVWHSRINRFEDMFGDPQVLASGAFVHAPGVRHPLIGSPVILREGGAGERPAPRSTAPGFGQHTDAVLGELGYTAKEVELLREQRAIA